MSRIFTDKTVTVTVTVVHNYRSNQSASMTRFGTDLRHQYGIFGGKSQTSFSRNATRAGSEDLPISKTRGNAMEAWIPSNSLPKRSSKTRWRSKAEGTGTYSLICRYRLVNSVGCAVSQN